MYAFASVAFVFLGELFSIYAELMASKADISKSYVSTFTIMFLVMVVAGALLVGGYMLGYIYLKNIWIVVAVSVACIALGEPLLTIVLFHETPTTGAFIGLVLGILGMLSALLIK